MKLNDLQIVFVILYYVSARKEFFSLRKGKIVFHAIDNKSAGTNNSTNKHIAHIDNQIGYLRKNPSKLE